MFKGKLLQFGAGNIGRSFLGQLFSVAGYEVVFVDVDRDLIDLINLKREYCVVIKSDSGDSGITVKNVRALHASDISEVISEIVSSSYIAVSVGQKALPDVIGVLARGLAVRLPENFPVDIIIAENIRNGAGFFRTHLKKLLPEGFPLDEKLGLVETSIGKMVPFIETQEQDEDRLRLFAEPYNTLIVDKLAFKSAIPDITTLKAVENIKAYVDRKLFVHNLGHAAAAYIGNRKYRNSRFIWQVLEDEYVLAQVKQAMLEASNALLAEYPETFKENDLLMHIDELIFRFRNRALNDTVLRVGKDLQRKLSRNDRIVGVILLANKHNLPWNALGYVYRCALLFSPENPYLPDEVIKKKFCIESIDCLTTHKLVSILEEVSGLDQGDMIESEIIRKLSEF